MQFFERRRIIIKTMEEEEVEEYYNQLSLEQREKLKQRKFHLVCKKCGKQFIAKTGNIKYCNNCKNK